jgi:uncharacterized membrane protein YgdD (TMEM256/DUF423 family)
VRGPGAIVPNQRHTHAPDAMPRTRLSGASGAVLAAAGTALAAYAAHGVDGEVRAHLYMAALFAFGNGIALAALAPRAARMAGAVALVALLAGSVLFAGSLVAARMFGVPSMAAPWGGMLMIGGWLALAVDLARR